MPDRILIAFVAELTLYGFGGVAGVFAELWCLLEKGEPNSHRIGGSRINAVWILDFATLAARFSVFPDLSSILEERNETGVGRMVK